MLNKKSLHCISTSGGIHEGVDTSLPVRVVCSKTLSDWHVEGLVSEYEENHVATVQSMWSTESGDERFWVDYWTASHLEELLQQWKTFVKGSCGFLRICQTEVHIETSDKAKRRGSSAILRMYVKSLPMIKRAKWLSPLLWSVSVALQRQGCPAKISGNELYIPLFANVWARVDLVSARE